MFPLQLINMLVFAKGHGKLIRRTLSVHSRQMFLTRDIYISYGRGSLTHLTHHRIVKSGQALRHGSANVVGQNLEYYIKASQNFKPRKIHTYKYIVCFAMLKQYGNPYYMYTSTKWKHFQNRKMDGGIAN